MLALLLAGGIAPQSAAWASDAVFLYITAYCLEAGISDQHRADVEGRVIDRAEVVDRLEMLPLRLFPNTVTHTRELTAGERNERFDFTLGLILRGLTPPT